MLFVFFFGENNQWETDDIKDDINGPVVMQD